MEVSISVSDRMDYQTGVAKKREGKGYTKMLLNGLVAHAPTNQLNVIPLCPFVLAHFQRHLEGYAAIWKMDGAATKGT